MIKLEEGNAKISGTRIDLLVELTYLMNVFIREGVANNSELETCVKTATMSNSELTADILGMMAEIFEKL